MVVLSCTLWNCSKSSGKIDEPDDPDNPENPTEVTLDISTSDLVFEAKGGEKEFTIYSNADWTITNESEWCKTDVTEGNGYGYVVVTVDAYSEMEDRNTNLTIKAGDKTEVLTVTQKHGDAIILSKDKFDVSQEGGEITIEVKSNIEYQVSIPNQFKSWIKETPETRAVTTKSFSFTISENETYEKREGYIVFSGNSLKDTVYVYQAQRNQLVLTEDTYNISSEGEDIEIELKTNIDYEIIIQPSEAASWISRITTRVIRTDKLNFHIEANTESNNRSVKIVIKDKNSELADMVVVNQAAKGTYAGDIIFKTEQDLVDFATIGDTKIIGNIIVQGSEIKTLQRLNNLLTEIDGSLTLDCFLTSLDGLYGLTKITGNLIIKKGSMNTFEGLRNLQTIGGDFEVNYYYGYSFEGLENLQIIEGSLKLISSNSYSYLNTLTSFKGLSSLKSIGGDLEVNANYSDYSSLASLESFEGLENLQTIGGSLKVIAKSKSENKSEYSATESKSLPSLTSFKGLSSLKSIGGDLEINADTYSSYYSLTKLESFEGLENLQTIGGSLKVTRMHLKSFKELNSLKSIGRDLEVNNYDGSSFEGLENIQIINKLAIHFCPSLNNINIFQNLKSINEISITHCWSLYDFCVLKNIVQNMSGTFYVNDCGYTPTKQQLLNGACSQTPNN